MRRVNLEQEVNLDPDVTEVCPVMIAVDVIISYAPQCVLKKIF